MKLEREVPRLLRRNVKRFRGGLVFKAHRLVYHSTLDLRVIKKKKYLGQEGDGDEKELVLGSVLAHQVRLLQRL